MLDFKAADLPSAGKLDLRPPPAFSDGPQAVGRSVGMSPAIPPSAPLWGLRHRTIEWRHACVVEHTDMLREFGGAPVVCQEPVVSNRKFLDRHTLLDVGLQPRHPVVIPVGEKAVSGQRVDG